MKRIAALICNQPLCTVLVSLVLIFAISLSIYGKIDAIPYDSDEVAWFYHTRYADLLIQGKFFDREWQTLEAYDHPPLSKYIYAAALYLYDSHYATARNQLMKDYGIWRALTISDFMQTPFSPYLRFMREINIPLITGIVLLTSLCTYMFTRDIWIACFNGILLLLNVKLITTLLRGVSDTHYVILMLVSMVYVYRYVKTRHLLYLIGASLAAGLSATSKLFGALYAVCMTLYLVVYTIMLHGKHIRAFRHILLMCICIVYVWYILNPTVYSSPIRHSYYYFTMRQSIFEYQIQHADEQTYVIHTPVSKIQTVLCTIVNTKWIQSCQDWSVTRYVYIHIALLLCGVYYLVKKAIYEQDAFVVFFILLTAYFFLVLSTISPFAWYRYYLVLILAETVFISCGLKYMFELGRLMCTWGKFNKRSY